MRKSPEQRCINAELASKLAYATSFHVDNPEASGSDIHTKENALHEDKSIIYNLAEDTLPAPLSLTSFTT